MYKLIAMDLDDTLLNDQLEITPRTRETLRRAVDKGVIATIATGRMYRSALPFARELGIEVPIITYQGALVKYALSGETLINRPVPLPLARDVLAEGYRRGIHINVYLNDTLYVDSITNEGTGYAKLAEVDMVAVGNLIKFLRNEPTKLLFIGDSENLDRLSVQMRQKFGNTLYITKSKPQYLEFLHPQATKGHALEAVASLYGIQRQQIMALGDSYNDLDMLEYAGLGIAMGNAPDEVKEKALFITGTNNEDGVASAVEKFILNLEK